MATGLDKDLASIQEARDLVAAAHAAQKQWASASQQQVDRVCAAMAEAGYAAAERLGAMAQRETGYGVASHKKLKNEFGSRVVWQSIRDMKTVGVIRHDQLRKLYEIAWPMGVVAGLVPSTNPTSTVFFKALIALKARDAIVFSPHPSAAQCTNEAARVMAEAAESAGAPQGLIGCISQISLPGTKELMTHRQVAVILATGGTPMVRAAHSTGKPAYGVGPGNVPVYVDRSADLKRAAKYIVASKAFDHSTICATEQAVIADQPIADQLADLMKAEGAYFVNGHQTEALRRLLFHPDGSINAATVGKSAAHLAALANFQVPNGTRIMVAPLEKIGKDELLSHEKMTTVLGWYTADGWEQGCEKSIAILHTGGLGHTQIIHAQNEKVIMAFGLEKPVFRILVNTMGTLGAIGFTTGLMPSLTLGPGGVGGAITGDNVTCYHLMNVKRLAYETMEPPLEALRAGASPVPAPEEIEQAVRQVVRAIMGS